MGEEPTPPTPNDDLTPDEERKFSKFLGKFLTSEDSPTPPTSPTPPPSTPPTQPSGDISAQIKAALADHDKEKGQSDTLGNLVKDVEALKSRSKQRHWWFRPFSPMSGD